MQPETRFVTRSSCRVAHAANWDGSTEVRCGAIMQARRRNKSLEKPGWKRGPKNQRCSLSVQPRWQRAILPAAHVKTNQHEFDVYLLPLPVTQHGNNVPSLIKALHSHQCNGPVVHVQVLLAIDEACNATAQRLAVAQALEVLGRSSSPDRGFQCDQHWLAARRGRALNQERCSARVTDAEGRGNVCQSVAAAEAAYALREVVRAVCKEAARRDHQKVRRTARGHARMLSWPKCVGSVCVAMVTQYPAERLPVAGASTRIGHPQLSVHAIGVRARERKTLQGEAAGALAGQLVCAAEGAPSSMASTGVLGGEWRERPRSRMRQPSCARRGDERAASSREKREIG
eukprot:6208304-Pleurochrysis_carterae.AAC.3